MMRNFLFMPLKFIYWGLLGSAGVAGFIAGRSGFRRVMKNRRAREVCFKISIFSILINLYLSFFIPDNLVC